MLLAEFPHRFRIVRNQGVRNRETLIPNQLRLIRFRVVDPNLADAIEDQSRHQFIPAHQRIV